jgi:hypothetical protein
VTARSARREWIPAPDPPDESTIALLCDRFRSVPGISEAWVVGSRITPDDGSPPRESTDIALVLDPPISDGPDEAVSFLDDLEERVPWSKPGQGWLLVTQTIIRAHEDVAVRIYPQP